MSGSGYADLKQVKGRLNISDSITQADEKIKSYMSEADDYVDVQAGLHAVTPFENPNKQLISLCSAYAAALYSYWNKKGEFDVCTKYEKKIGEHIRAVYGKRNPDGLTANTFVKTNSAIRGNESGSVN